MKVPIMYQIVLDRIKKESPTHIISLSRARYILGFIFRIPSQSIAMVLAEMQTMKLIRINGQRFIHIIQEENNV